MTDPGETAKAIVTLSDAISSVGLKILTFVDLSAFKVVAEQARGGDIDPQFDHDNFDFHSGNSIGFCLETGEGEVVCSQAMRFDPLGRVGLGEILKNQQRRLYATKQDGGAIEFVHTPTLGGITGDAVYHGGFWFSQHHKDYKKGAIDPVATFVKYAHFIALSKWSPSCIYGLMQPAVVYSGLAARCWITRQEPSLIKWSTLPSRGDVWEGEFLVSLTYDDLVQQVGLVNEGAFLQHQRRN